VAGIVTFNVEALEAGFPVSFSELLLLLVFDMGFDCVPSNLIVLTDPCWPPTPFSVGVGKLVDVVATLAGIAVEHAPTLVFRSTFGLQAARLLKFAVIVHTISMNGIVPTPAVVAPAVSL
jgi:hypothetical protein